QVVESIERRIIETPPDEFLAVPPALRQGKRCERRQLIESFDRFESVTPAQAQVLQLVQMPQGEGRQVAAVLEFQLLQVRKVGDRYRHMERFQLGKISQNQILFYSEQLLQYRVE